MPIFEYKALNETGQPTTGTIDADTAKEARDRLRAKRIHVTEMTKVTRQQVQEGGGFHLADLFGRRNFAEIALITRQFSTLLRSGIPVADALTALVQQIESPSLQRVFRQIREDVTTGSTVGDAFERHPRYFSELYVNMIRAGEASGSLDTILQRLSQYLQKQAQLRGRVKAAMTYPMIMMAAGTMVVIFLMSYVVPKITSIIIEQGNTLPLPTEILILISDVIRDFWPFLLGGVILLYSGYRMFVRSESGKLTRDRWMLKLPIFGNLFRKQAVGRFASTFSTLLGSGIPALQCLKILQTTVENRVLALTLEEVHDRIIEGADISTPMKKATIFPPVVGYMVAIGEQSGQLEDILDRIAESYDEEIELTTQRVTSLIEPIIIILMAVVVGFIVMAVVLPLVEGFEV